MRRSRLIIILYASLALSVACQREQMTSPNKPPGKTTTVATGRPQDLSNAKVNEILPLAAAPLEKSILGGRLGADKNVAAEQIQFTPGQPIYLTVWLKDSPKGLQTSVRWFDAEKKEITSEAHPMNGAKVTTFSLKQKLKPGKYHVTCYWGGNEACDYDFEVIQPKKK